MKGISESYYEPECKYSEVCTDKGEKCKFCKHNARRSYYAPARTFPTWISPPYTLAGGTCVGLINNE